MPGPRQFSFANAEQPTGRPTDFGGSLPSEEDELDVFAPRPAPLAKPVTTKVKPANLVALAKARIKDIKRELREKRALEKELAELERLVEAAEGRLVKHPAGRVIGISK